MIKVNYLGEEKTFSPQQISSMVLSKMKDISEAKLGKTVKKAVVTLVFALSGIRIHAELLQCACILQRLAASGDERCWCHCWS